MSDRTVAFITGYHHCTPPNPLKDTKETLCYRLAIVLNSYREDSVNMVFDDELYCSVVQAVVDYFEIEFLKIQADGALSACNSASDLMDYYSKLAPIDREPPTTIRFVKDSHTIVVGATEFWVHCGGSREYHDSYTLSLFTSLNDSSSLRAMCEKAVLDAGGVVVSSQASPHPVARSLWQKVAAWLFGS